MLKKIALYIKIIRQQRHKCRFIASRILMKSGLSRYIVFHRNTYNLRFHPSSLTASLWVNPKERLEEEAFISSIVEAGDIAIDVGANIGTVSFALSKKTGQSGKILAFEPHPAVFTYLADNIALNGLEECIKPYCMALGETVETLYFSDQSDDTNNAVSDKGTIEIHVKRLDDMVARDKAVRLLKIDVEGFEYQVLLGAKETCKNTDIIYLECIPAMLEPNGGSERKICAFLEDLGFKISQVMGDTLVDNVIGSHKKKMLLARRI